MAWYEVVFLHSLLLIDEFWLHQGVAVLSRRQLSPFSSFTLMLLNTQEPQYCCCYWPLNQGPPAVLCHLLPSSQHRLPRFSHLWYHWTAFWRGGDFIKYWFLFLDWCHSEISTPKATVWNRGVYKVYASIIICIGIFSYTLFIYQIFYH